MYMILDASSGSALPGVSFFDTPQKAAAAAKRIATSTGIKTRIKQVVQDDWRGREATRLKDGTYAPLPSWWLQAPWWVGSTAEADHFAHISADGESIAFTETPEKGALDRQLKMGVTAYLGRFFGGKLGGYEIGSIAARLLYGDLEVKFSKSPADFQRVYEEQDVFHSCSDNPSCMRYNRTDFRSSPAEIHPAYVFGAGDLAIAWIEHKDSTPDNFKIVARAVVYPKEKTYVRTYGTSEQMNMALTEKLKADGYKRTDCFKGARLLKVECRGGLVMPYIDGDHSVEVRGKFLRLDYENGDEYSPTETDGLLYLDGYGRTVECFFSGNEILESEGVGVIVGPHHSEMCDPNLLSQYAMECEVTGQWLCKNIARSIILVKRLDGSFSTCYRVLVDYGDIFQCGRSGLYFWIGEYRAFRVHTNNGIETWCEISVYDETLAVRTRFEFAEKTYFNSLSTTRQNELLSGY
jgi:hypothetical protein